MATALNSTLSPEAGMHSEITSRILKALSRKKYVVWKNCRRVAIIIHGIKCSWKWIVSVGPEKCGCSIKKIVITR